MAKDESTQTNTIVGPNTVVQGNLDIKGSLLVYGTVLGDIRSDGLVRTAKDSLIKGAVVAREAVFDGELDGSLKTKGRATLGATAKMVGELRVGLLVIEEGAQFSGKCAMEGAKIRAADKRGDGSPLKVSGEVEEEKEEASS
jgi:cytoskeletal protein CcmA (bactofilin family)